MGISGYFDGTVEPRLPSVDAITIDHIALVLSRLPRFMGQTDPHQHPLSVAQHCVHVADTVSLDYRLEALLHAAQEAYVGAIPPQWRARMPEIRHHERQAALRVRERFGLPAELSHKVAVADRRVLAAEKRDLIAEGIHWPVIDGVEPSPATILPWPHYVAYQLFMRRYNSLAGAGHAVAG